MQYDKDLAKVMSAQVKYLKDGYPNRSPLKANEGIIFYTNVILLLF